MAIGETAGILFKIKGDASDAVRAIKDTEGAAGGLTGSLAGLANPATIAAAAVAAIGTAALVTGKALFDLTKSSAELGSTIFDASQKTGLAAATISSLKVAAEQSGSSLDAVTGGLARFARTIGEAGDGSDKAQLKLAKLGVTSKDLDTALGQALKTISGYPPGVQQMTAAQEAFGKSGADLIPFIRSFDGDLPALIKKCKELGLTLSDSDAAAADQFGDSLDQLKGQAAIAGVALTKDLMPVLAKMFNDLGTWYATNQNEIRAWGRTIADTVSATIGAFKILINFIRDNWAYLRVGLAVATGGASELVGGIVNAVQNARAANTRPQAQEAGGGTGRVDFNADGSPLGTSPAAEKVRSQTIGRADNQSDVDEAFRRAAASRVAIAEKGIQAVLDLERASNAELVAMLDQRIATETVTEAQHQKELGKIKLDALLYEKELYKQQLAENRDLTADDKLEYKRRIAILDKQISVQRIETSLSVKKALDEETAAIDKNAEAQAKRSKTAQEAADKDYADFKAKQERERQDALRRKLQQTVGSGFEISAIGQLQDYFASEGNTTAIAGIEALTNAFSGLGQAVGQVVQAWVLYGNAGTSVRKVTAQILASIAQQAAIKAIFELAEGFAALALAFFGVPNAGPSATAHFTAAAIYGGIAGVAAVAGRAVAGDSFKQQTGSATGGSGSSTNRNVQGQGSQYSGQPDAVYGGSRNAPAVKVQLEVKLRSGGVIDIVENSIKTNGRMRDLIVDAN